MKVKLVISELKGTLKGNTHIKEQLKEVEIALIEWEPRLDLLKTSRNTQLFTRNYESDDAINSRYVASPQ